MTRIINLETTMIDAIDSIVDVRGSMYATGVFKGLLTTILDSEDVPESAKIRFVSLLDRVAATL